MRIRSSVVRSSLIHSLCWVHVEGTLCVQQGKEEDSEIIVNQEDLFGPGTLAKLPRRVRGSDGTLTGLTRGKGLSADANGHSSGRAKALHRLERHQLAAYFSASLSKEGW